MVISAGSLLQIVQQYIMPPFLMPNYPMTSISIIVSAMSTFLKDSRFSAFLNTVTTQAQLLAYLPLLQCNIDVIQQCERGMNILRSMGSQKSSTSAQNVANHDVGLGGHMAYVVMKAND
jgi:hypothetical protein